MLATERISAPGDEFLNRRTSRHPGGGVLDLDFQNEAGHWSTYVQPSGASFGFATVPRTTLDPVMAGSDGSIALRGGARRSSLFSSITVQLLMMEASIVAMVLVGIEVLDTAFPGSREMLRLAVASAIGVFAIGGIVEALAAVRATTSPPESTTPMPSTTGIIAAYLPNEAPIIVDTVAHHLRTGPPDLELIVAYNTPMALPVEFELERLAAREPRLRILRVEHSRSKAENVNAALDIATGEIVGVFDSDHHPEEGCYEQAWRWLADGADAVQGRCAVRPLAGSRNQFLTHVVAAEFEQMYAVGHPGRTRLHGFGLFGGSNGFWRTATLREIKLDPSALTEDIDASVRLLRTGGRIVTDPSIVSAELAPPSMRALCQQRLRWAQGWFQVRRRHLAGIFGNREIALRSRLGAVWLFGVGTIMAWIGALVLPMTIDGWIRSDSSIHRSPIVGLLFAFGTAAFLVQVAVAYHHALPRSRRPRVFLTYLAANLIFYAYLRIALVRLSHVHELYGRSVWHVTPRS